MFPETILLEDRLHLEDAVDFCLNKEENALQALREKHEKKCFPGGYYIISVNSIKSITPVFIEQQDQRAESYTCCTFEATAKKYEKGDIIPICKVKHFGPVLETENADNNIVFREDPIYDSIPDGSFVPALIETAKGFQNRPSVNITASLYKPVAHVCFFLSDSKKPDLTKLKARVQELKPKKDDSNLSKLYFRNREVPDGDNSAIVFTPLKGTIEIKKIAPVEGALVYRDDAQVAHAIRVYYNLISESQKYWTKDKFKANKQIWAIYGKL